MFHNTSSPSFDKKIPGINVTCRILFVIFFADTCHCVQKVILVLLPLLFYTYRFVTFPLRRLVLILVRCLLPPPPPHHPIVVRSMLFVENFHYQFIHHCCWHRNRQCCKANEFMVCSQCSQFVSQKPIIQYH